MTNDEIEKLKKVLKRILHADYEAYHRSPALSKAFQHRGSRRLLWVPDHNTACEVKAIGPHAEEGDDTPCAIFWDGKYVALYNCDLGDFSVTERIK